MKIFIDYINDYFQVDITNLSRKTKERQARQVYMYCLRQVGYQHAQIALGIGMRQHSTSINACNKVEWDMVKNELLKVKVSECLNAFKKLNKDYIKNNQIQSDLKGFKFCREEKITYAGGETVIERVYIKTY